MSAYLQIISEIKGKSITLVAVTKGRSINEIRALYDLGCRHFAENRVDAALEKMGMLPQDIHWHLIGTLQKNKVRKIIGKFFLIHSVDSAELAKKISDCSLEAGIQTDILIQINTSGEVSKHGMDPESFDLVKKFPGISIKGLMTMAPLSDNRQVIRNCFSKLRELKEKWGLKELSMGMSQDYPLAIEEGATLLRIGRRLYES